MIGISLHRLESQLVLRWVSDSSRVPPQSLSEPSQQESQLRLSGRFASQRCLECPDSLAQQVNISLVNLLSRVHKPVCTCVSLGLSVPEGDVHILSYTGTHILTCSPGHFCPFVHSGWEESPCLEVTPDSKDTTTPLTSVIRNTGSLAAGWGAQDIVAVHEEALIVFSTLGVHNGDVWDDGNCRAERSKPGPLAMASCPPSQPLPATHWTWAAWAVWPG